MTPVKSKEQKLDQALTSLHSSLSAAPRCNAVLNNHECGCEKREPIGLNSVS